MKAGPMNPYACAVEVDEHNPNDWVWEYVNSFEMFTWMLLYGLCVDDTHAYLGITPIHTRAWICVPTA